MKGLIGGLLLLSLISEPCAAADDGWYGSLDLGRSRFTGLSDSSGPFGFYNSEFVHFSHAVDESVDDHGSSYRIAAGYEFNAHFALEAGYVNLGQARIKFAPQVPPFGPPGGNHSDLTIKDRGFLAEAVGTLPLTRNWSLFCRAGPIVSHTQGYSTTLTFLGKDSVSATRLTYGIGTAWALSKSLSLQLVLDRYVNLSDAVDIGEFNVYVTSFGLKYSFH